jgi:hypothetical protein
MHNPYRFCVYDKQKGCQLIVSPLSRFYLAVITGKLPLMEEFAGQWKNKRTVK